MKRAMIIGAAGLLGQYLSAEAVKRGLDVTATFNRTRPEQGAVPLVHLDITDADAVATIISRNEPDMVFLPSALTNVDHCETHPQEAWAVNAEGTLNVASACKDVKARLLYVSTDYVFNGEKGEKYYEFDTPDPMSLYAQTKLEGERLTLDADRHNIVARVSVLYGWNRVSDKTNFVTWVLKNLRQGSEVKLFGDQRASPTYAPNAADAMLTMAAGNASGLYHVAGPNCLSRHEMGLTIADAFGLDRSLCKNVRTEDVPLPARRGKMTCLDINKTQAEFNITMTSFVDGLSDMRATE
jgi:dTDP-4-dehydrorhamnose reductase